MQYISKSLGFKSLLSNTYNLYIIYIPGEYGSIEHAVLTL